MDVHDDVLYTGWVEKKGALRRNWTKRMLVLKKHHLLYYADKNMKDEKGRIALRDIKQARMGKERKKRKLFFVDATNRTYLILVSSDEAAHLWIEKINAAATENASLRQNATVSKARSRRPAKQNYIKKAHTLRSRSSGSSRSSRAQTESSGSTGSLRRDNALGRSRTVGSQPEFVDEDYAPLPSRYNTAPVESYLDLQEKRRLSTGGGTSMQKDTSATKKKKCSRDNTPKTKRKDNGTRKKSPTTHRRAKKNQKLDEDYAVPPTFYEEDQDYTALPLFSSSSSEDLNAISPLRPKSHARMDDSFYTPLPNVLDSSMEENSISSMGALTRKIYSASSADGDDGYACLPPPI